MKISPAPKTSPPLTVRILLVDDHPMIRERLTEIINHERDLRVCGAAEDRHGALALIEQLRPDLAIVDLNLKRSHGLELIKDVQARFAGLRVLVLSMYDVPLYAERALRAGAVGYITKREATRKIIAAIRYVLSGEIYLSANLAAELKTQMFAKNPTAQPSPMHRLTDREIQVIELIGHGHTTGEIAKQMNLDVGTIDGYRSRIRRKLKINDSSELLREAYKWVANAGSI